MRVRFLPDPEVRMIPPMGPNTGRGAAKGQGGADSVGGQTKKHEDCPNKDKNHQVSASLLTLVVCQV